MLKDFTKPKITPDTQIWDFENEKLLIPEKDAINLLSRQSIPGNKSADTITAQLKQIGKKPFSLVRLGAIDTSFLALNDLPASAKSKVMDKLWCSDLDPKNIPDPEEYVKLLQKADLIACYQTDNTPVQFWGPTLHVLNKWNLLNSKKFVELHTIYWLAANGTLFQSLKGKKVVLVGGKAEPFYHYYFQNPHYRQAFHHLGLEDIRIVGVVPTPDYGEYAMNARKKIESMVRATYHAGPDVFLFGAGILGNYLAVMVKEDGKTGIDIGATLDSMMNWPNKRPGMDIFHQYQHPDIEFSFHPAYSKLQTVVPKTVKL